MSDTEPLVNTVTFQVWIGCVLLGFVLSIALGTLTPFMILPWVGLFLGVMANESLPPKPGNTTGVRFVK